MISLQEQKPTLIFDLPATGSEQTCLSRLTKNDALISPSVLTLECFGPTNSFARFTVAKEQKEHFPSFQLFY